MNAKVTKSGAREALAQKILIGCGLFGGLVGAAMAVLDQHGVVVPRALLALAAIAAIGVGGWLTVIYWRNVDEAAREAHKFAWFWGGSGGLLLALPILALLDTPKLEALFGAGGDPARWVWLGVFGLLLLQLAGYGLVWAGWWLIRRR
ncbi:MAG: hypothetical protein PSX79_08575 [bacterium]|nr:hypothetical protein [bacterium]